MLFAFTGTPLHCFLVLARKLRLQHVCFSLAQHYSERQKLEKQLREATLE
jgi:hypothetical protein